MLSLDEFDGLSVGDVVEALGGLFPKLGQEPVKLRVKKKEADRADFVVTYFGVTLGSWACTRKEGVLTWEM